MRRYYKRAFLNKPKHESIGLVLADAEVTDADGLVAELTIGDCSRQITLNFSVWLDPGKKPGKRKVANIRHKAELLRQTVNEFLNAVEVGLQEIEERG